ncbi:DUF4407 domain-containing protein [Frankia sp. AgB32]|uniref:DUF4407 domain-containing protein n=1 Tax=Frankia sp. AgB32 TaxID=631119 RepID=UPI00200EED18|nr:DUF4407 domain-containing protein [Frankia sp. AgB32]MCK9893667.1 DUF4407 domain-containing protein [Frankia sp. AgB32]
MSVPQPGESATPPGPSLSPSALLLWCAGVDRALLGSRRLRLLYAAYGLFLLLVATLAATSFTILASVVLDRFEPWVIPFALLWALFVFAADRVIVMEPKHVRAAGTRRFWRARRSRGMPLAAAMPAPDTATDPGPTPTPDPDPDPVADPSGRPPSRLGTSLKYLLRFALAILAAILVSEALLMVAFSPEINQKLVTTHDNRILAEQRRLRAAELLPDQSKRDGLEKKIKSEQPVVDGLRHEVEAKAPTITPELQFLPQGKAYHELVTEFNTKNAELQGDIRLRDETDRTIAETSGQPLPQPSEKFLANEKRSGGFLARVHALDDVIHNEPTGRVWLWVIRATLLIFDLLPLMIKILAWPTPYDQAVALQDAALGSWYRRLFRTRNYAGELEADVWRAAMRAWHTTELDYIDFTERNGVRPTGPRPPWPGPGGRHG